MIPPVLSQKIDSTKNSRKIPPVIQSAQGPSLIVEGKKLLNFCSSHYLGFANDSQVKDAVKKAVSQYGIGTGYRTLAGTNILHVELENKLAAFKGAEAAILLSGGYMANCAAIQTIIGKEDVVISDELNHASIIDAIKLSGVKNKYIYSHKNMEELEMNLTQASKLAKPDGSKPLILIVTDGVFSMDGDLAPLPDIVKLAQKYQALVMVDDAHGEGVLGRGGRGIVDHFGLHGEVDIEVGTLSKAFSVIGGFITGKKDLIDYYKQNARQFLFSSALTIPDTAGVLEALNELSTSTDRVDKLWKNADFLKSEFTKLGFNTGKSETPIIPVMLGDEDIALQFSSRLLENGVFATSIRYPMVAKGLARIRVIPSAAHSKTDLQQCVNAFKKVGKELGVIS